MKFINPLSSSTSGYINGMQRLTKIFELIAEIFGWLEIAASPFLIALAIGAAIYFPHPTTIRLVAGLSIGSIGLIGGIIWATRIWKTKGTMWFISRVAASPDLDDLKGDSVDKPAH